MTERLLLGRWLVLVLACVLLAILGFPLSSYFVADHQYGKCLQRSQSPTRLAVEQCLFLYKVSTCEGDGVAVLRHFRRRGEVCVSYNVLSVEPIIVSYDLAGRVVQSFPAYE